MGVPLAPGALLGGQGTVEIRRWLASPRVVKGMSVVGVVTVGVPGGPEGFSQTSRGGGQTSRRVQISTNRSVCRTDPTGIPNPVGEGGTPSGWTPL